MSEWESGGKSRDSECGEEKAKKPKEHGIYDLNLNSGIMAVGVAAETANGAELLRGVRECK